MADQLLDPEVESTSPRQSWFTRPLSRTWCVIGWLVATGVFLFWVFVPGGPGVGDAYEHIYTTWAFSHAQFTCMYAPHDPRAVTAFTAPVFPMISGGIGQLIGIGHGVPFPSGPALGHNCGRGIQSMIHWSEASGALWPTLRTGLVLGWLALMIGLILVLRISGRGRQGWEPAALLIVACCPPVWLSVEWYSHPQDLMAMGLALAATACALRSHWIGAGILVALAVLTQQFALLVAAPLLFVAPRSRRVPYLTAAILTAAIIIFPILGLTAGSAGRWIFLGSGDSAGIGGTVLWEFHLHGALLVLLSRIVPLVGSATVSWYAARRFGQAALQPAVLVALVAVSLSLRLVFEQNIFAYYYMALVVTLVVLDVIHGRLRETLVAWIAMIALVYSEPVIVVWRQSWGQTARHWLPFVVMIVALLLIVRSAFQHRFGWNVAMWAALVVTALVTWPISSDPLHHQSVTWLWQVVLVGIGVTLAVGPFVTLARNHSVSRLQGAVGPSRDDVVESDDLTDSEGAHTPELRPSSF